MSILDPRPPQVEDGALARMAYTLGEDPFERLEELREAGKRKALAEGICFRLDHERKSLLARLAGEYAVAHAKEGLSEARLERFARADDRYQKHIEGAAAAVEERELATSEYYALRSRLEWLRAALAHENALTRMDTP